MAKWCGDKVLPAKRALYADLLEYRPELERFQMNSSSVAGDST
jgi:hypothetical protein